LEYVLLQSNWHQLASVAKSNDLEAGQSEFEILFWQ